MKLDYERIPLEKRRRPIFGSACLLFAVTSLIAVLVPDQFSTLLNAIGPAFPVSWLVSLVALVVSLGRSEHPLWVGALGMLLSAGSVLQWLMIGGASYFGGSP